MGRSKAPSLPIKALFFCRPTELRAERWYAVPKGDETAGLGGFLGLTGPMGRRVLKFDGAFGPEGCGIALTGDKFCMPPKAAGLSLLRSRILFSDICRLIV